MDACTHVHVFVMALFISYVISLDHSCLFFSNEGDNIKVYVRIRPPLKQISEGNVDNSVCLEASSPKSLTIFTKPEPKQFSYDHVADIETTQVKTYS